MCEKVLHIDVVGTDKSDWGAKSNLRHRKILPHRPSSTKLVSFSTIDCFDTTIYIHMMDPKHKISGWGDEHVYNPPPRPPRRLSQDTEMGGGGTIDFCILDMVKKPVTIINDESVYELPTVIVAAFFTGK